MKSIHLKLMAIFVAFSVGASAGELTAQSSWHSGNAGCSGGQCQHGNQYASDPNGMSSYRPPFSGGQPYGLQRPQRPQRDGSPQTFRGAPSGGYRGLGANQAFRSPYAMDAPGAAGYSGGCSGGNCQGHPSNSNPRESYFDEPRMNRQPSSFPPNGGSGYRSQQPADLAPSLNPRSEQRFFGSASIPSPRGNPARSRLELYTANGLPAQGPVWAETPAAGRTSDESRRSVLPRTRAGFSEALPATPYGLSQSDSMVYLPPPQDNFNVTPYSARPNSPRITPGSPTGADGHDHSKCNHNH